MRKSMVSSLFMEAVSVSVSNCDCVSASKCIKRSGSDGGAHSAPTDHIAGFKGSIFLVK